MKQKCKGCGTEWSIIEIQRDVMDFSLTEKGEKVYYEDVDDIVLAEGLYEIQNCPSCN